VQRRDFITLAGSAAATWPLVAGAQQRERMRRIGVLMNLTPDDAEGQARLAAFLQGLQEAGWAVGRNVRIDLRWGGGDPDSFRNKRRSWSRSHRTLFSPVASRPRLLCCRRPAP